MTTHQQKQSLEKWMRWERQGSPSSHWTIALFNESYLVFLFALALVHIFLANYLPPAEDELYYWNWAQHLRLSYFDHPPMVAYLIRASTTIFGNSLFGIRFFGIVSTFIVMYVLGALCDRRYVIAFLLASPLIVFGALLMTPDVPFLLFWTLYIYWLTRINQIFSNWSDDPVARVYHSAPIPILRWVLGGILLGLGLLSKYSMLMIIPCTALVLVSRYRISSWLNGFLLHIFIALLVATPVILFNYQHHFEPFKYQLNHIGITDGAHFWNFVGGQVALVGALPFLMLPWVLLQAKDINSSFKHHVCFIFFMAPLAYVLFQASRSYVEANWGLMSYITFWPIAERLIQYTSFKGPARIFVAVCFLPALGATLLLLVHLFHPLPQLKPEKDRVFRLKAQMELAKSVAADLKENQRTEPVFSHIYQWVSYLRFLGVDANQLFPGSKFSVFTIEPHDACQHAKVIVLYENTPPPEALTCFKSKEILREYPLIVRGQEVLHFFLAEYSKE